MISVDKDIFSNVNLFSKKYNLAKLLNDLGNPQNNIKVINVVGTNGKGSTSLYLSKGLKNKFDKVGLFISPAFLHHNERIQINNESISDNELMGIISEWKDKINKYELTFFEIWTFIAIQYFIKNKIEVAVIEAGIGGMLDSTKCFQNRMCVVVTSISLDHTEVLGENIEDIVYQKLNIANHNDHVILSNDNMQYDDFIQKHSPTINYQYANTYNEAQGVQKLNAGIAKLVFEILDINVSQNIYSETPLGRFSILNEEPKFIIDGAHNIDGIKKLSEAIKEKDDFVVLYASSSHKDHDEILIELMGNFKNVNLTTFNHVKAWQINEKYKEFTVDNWQIFLENNIDKNILVCGSLYFIPQVFEWFNKRR